MGTRLEVYSNQKGGICGSMRQLHLDSLLPLLVLVGSISAYAGSITVEFSGEFAPDSPFSGTITIGTEPDFNSCDTCIGTLEGMTGATDLFGMVPSGFTYDSGTPGALMSGYVEQNDGEVFCLAVLTMLAPEGYATLLVDSVADTSFSVFTPSEVEEGYISLVSPENVQRFVEPPDGQLQMNIVPEPNLLWLTALGGVGLAAYRRFTGRNSHRCLKTTPMRLPVR